MENTNVAKLDDAQKEKIATLVKREIRKLGTQHKVAVKCGVSDATIDQIKNMTYNAKGDDMWLKIAAKLGWQPDKWAVVDNTIDAKLVYQALDDAKNRSMFIGIAEPAGGGKSAGIDAFRAANEMEVFYISCREWSRREMMIQLLLMLGVDPKPGYPIQMLLEKVIDFFKVRTNKPLLILDQANSLQPSVLTFLIFLYNECEDNLGVVIAGTEELEQKIKRGVKRNYRGFDELDSRFGRSYVRLFGAPLNDVKKICKANGISDENIVKRIFDRCNPVMVEVPDEAEGKIRKVMVVKDKRLIKRAVQAELLLRKETV